MPRILALLGLIAYPFASFYGAQHGYWGPALAALSALVLGTALMLNSWARIFLSVVAVGIVIAAVLGVGSAGESLVYAQPVLINLGLASLFGHTLLDGRTPLITRFIRVERGELDSRMRRYGLQLTRAWTLFALVLALESLLVALFAERKTWALVTGFVNYALTGLFFVVEYQVRVRVLCHLEHRGFIHFLAFLARCRPAAVLED